MTTLPLAIERLPLKPDVLSGQVAVVTGGGRGIGREIVWAFARLGASVVIAELSESLGKEVEDAVRREGGQAFFIPTDVSNPDSVANLVSRTHTAFGPVDILINNAIVIGVTPVAEMDLAFWDRVIAVNLRGTFLTCKAFLPDMLSRRHGTIVNMTSAGGMPGLSAYFASKQGIVGFSQSLAAEVGGQGVNVVAFAPGMVDTPGIRGVSADLAPRLGMTADQFLTMSLHSAYSGLMPAEDAAAATAYLAACLAGEYHGQTVEGYSILEQAGYLKKPSMPDSRQAELQPEGVTSTSGEECAGKIRNAAQVAGQLLALLEEHDREFDKFPVFIRPIARQGFKGKTGKSIQDWKRTADSLVALLEPLSSSGKTSADLRSVWPSRQADLEKLAGYFEGVPAETARFTRDDATLREVSKIASRRVQVVRSLQASLDRLLS